jgi:hypothetical protein
VIVVAGPGELTDVEHEAMAVSAQLAALLTRVTGNGSTRRQDMAELFAHLHAIQTAVLAQATARKYPELYRLLGEVLPGD